MKTDFNDKSLIETGNQILLYRKYRGLTQQELAIAITDKTGNVVIDPKHISAIESGQRNITIRTLNGICIGLECTFAELFSFTEGDESK